MHMGRGDPQVNARWPCVARPTLLRGTMTTRQQIADCVVRDRAMSVARSTAEVRLTLNELAEACQAGDKIGAVRARCRLDSLVPLAAECLAEFLEGNR